MKLLAKVMAEVQRSPATSRDIADSLGVPVKTACAVLCDLHQTGSVRKKTFIRTEKNRKMAIWEPT